MRWGKRKSIWTLASALAIWITFACPANTQSSQILVLSSHDAQPYQEVLAEFRGYLDERGVGATYETFIVDGNLEKAVQSIAQVKQQAPALIYSLGSLATRYVLRSIRDRPVLVSLVINLEDLGSGSNTTGVLLNFPPTVQLEWLKRLLPGHEQVGVLFSSDTNQRMLEATKGEAIRLGLSLVPQKIESPKDLPGALRRLSKRVDVLWVIPDKAILPAQSAKAILLSSFRNRIPVVGPSTSWVKAGALYALDWDYKEIGRQSGELAEQMLKGIPVQKIRPESPHTVLYSLNLKTARHMKLDLDDALVNGANQVFR